MTRPAGKPFAVLVAIALTSALAFALACTSSDAQPAAPGGSQTPGAPSTTGQPATSAEDALARYVQNRLIQGFVPNCFEAERPQDVGKQCAIKLGERGDLVAYALGPTFSEPTRILILRPENGDWALVTIKTLDPDMPTAPGIPWPLAVGEAVVVAGTAPDCLKIREEPGIGGAELDCIPDGTSVTVVGGPSTQDNIDWWQLQDFGWAAGDYLRYPDAAPTATPD